MVTACGLWDCVWSTLSIYTIVQVQGMKNLSGTVPQRGPLSVYTKAEGPSGNCKIRFLNSQWRSLDFHGHGSWSVCEAPWRWSSLWVFSKLLTLSPSIEWWSCFVSGEDVHSISSEHHLMLKKKSGTKTTTTTIMIQTYTTTFVAIEAFLSHVTVTATVFWICPAARNSLLFASFPHQKCAKNLPPPIQAHHRFSILIDRYRARTTSSLTKMWCPHPVPSQAVVAAITLQWVGGCNLQIEEDWQAGRMHGRWSIATDSADAITS